MIQLIITLIIVGYVLFYRACKTEWKNEDLELFLTEGTGHD